MIENLIEGIKIMKLYAWELPFLKFIFTKRKDEISQKAKIMNYNGILQVFSISGIALEIFITLYVQVQLGKGLDPGEVFLVVTVFYLTHLIIVYICTTGIATMFVFTGIMKRTGQVLLLKDFSDLSVNPEDKYSIQLTNAVFS